MPRHRWPSLFALLCAGCFYVTEEERAARWDLDGDGVERPADCDDSDRSLADDRRYYADADGDGYGDPRAPILACTAPTGFVDNDLDCDDTDSLTFPDAAERCDGADNDCDLDVDEGLSLVEWFPDVDLDGYGDDGASVRACGRPDGHVAIGGDCDDTNPMVNPDADEVCNGVDDDCVNGIDDADPAVILTTWYEDGDGDGYGSDASATRGCEPPANGWVEVGGDCRPNDPSVHPGADEVCNTLDDDCDGRPDLDALDAERYFEDADGDGYGDIARPVDACPLDPSTGDTGLDYCALAPPGLTCGTGDCDASDPDVHPGVREVCANGIDDNCDGQVDEGGCVP